MTRVAAFVPDLMDRSRLAGIEIEFVAAPAALATVDADVVVIDLGRAGALEALASLAGRRTIAFGSHVDRELLDAARSAGCTDVMTRSEFFRRYRELLGDGNT